MNEESTEIVAVPNQVQLGTIQMRPEEVIERASQIATQLAKIIRDRGLSTRIRDKDHVRVEGWTTLGAVLGVIPRERNTVRTEQGFESYVELIRTSDGVVVGGASAVCCWAEPRWSKADDYAVRSMAITRATGKAYRLGFSWIMVLAGYSPTPAEEMGQGFDQVIEGTVVERPGKETSPKGPVQDTQTGKFQPPKAQDIPPGKTPETTSGTTSTAGRQKNQWPDVQKILKTLVQDGLIDSLEHAVGILNHSVFISVAEGKLELYDIAVYLCGYQTWPQTWTTEDKATATNNQYLAGAPKEWEDAAKHILGMKL